jgi:hypothetical protein
MCLYVLDGFIKHKQLTIHGFLDNYYCISNTIISLWDCTIKCWGAEREGVL